jgi:protein ImuA
VKAAAHLALWRADQIDRSASADDVRPTGHAALDAELPGGGWPAAGLTELLLIAPGSGELRLLAPMLAVSSLSHSAAPLLWVAPPFTPYAPALAALGLPVDRLTLARPASAADVTWAAEQALRSGALAAVLWWEGCAHTTTAMLRRLHLAATDGRTPLFALRPAAARAQSSPAPLRLALEPAAAQQLSIDVFKRRGPPMAAPLRLALPAVAPAAPRRRAPRRIPAPQEPPHAVVRLAPERAAA